VANEKEPYILIGLYELLYKERYNKKPRINKFREKWAMQTYYFKTNKSGHPLNFFFYNFDKIDYLKIEIEKDIKNRRALREATKKLVEGEAE